MTHTLPAGFTPLFLSAGLAGCVSVSPHVRSFPAPPVPDGPLNPAEASPASGGRRVPVRYQVSCSHCWIRFTDANGETAGPEEAAGSWRHREYVSVGHRTVSLSVHPHGEKGRVTSVRILVNDFERAKAVLPGGGSAEMVVITAGLAGVVSHGA